MIEPCSSHRNNLILPELEEDDAGENPNVFLLVKTIVSWCLLVWFSMAGCKRIIMERPLRCCASATVLLPWTTWQSNAFSMHEGANIRDTYTYTYMYIIYIYIYVWLSPTPLKNDRVKVSWDDDIPNVPNHQPQLQLSPESNYQTRGEEETQKGAKRV